MPAYALKMNKFVVETYSISLASTVRVTMKQWIFLYKATVAK
jgi:hypothetical protein